MNHKHKLVQYDIYWRTLRVEGRWTRELVRERWKHAWRVFSTKSLVVVPFVNPRDSSWRTATLLSMRSTVRYCSLPVLCIHSVHHEGSPCLSGVYHHLENFSSLWWCRSLFGKVTEATYDLSSAGSLYATWSTQSSETTAIRGIKLYREGFTVAKCKN